MTSRNITQLTTPTAPVMWTALYETNVFAEGGGPGVRTQAEPGHWQLDMVFDPANPEHKTFLDTLETTAKEVADAAFPNGTRKDPLFPSRPDVDENKQETGAVRIRFRLSAGGISRKTGKIWARSVPILGADLKPMELEGELANGSVVSTSFEVVPYDFGGVGVSLRLKAVCAIRVEYRQARSTDAASDFSGLNVASDFANTVDSSDGDF